MKNITEAEIKSIAAEAEEKMKLEPAPKLKLWDKLYGKYGEEYRVVNMRFHIDINYIPCWNYSIVLTRNIRILSNGYVLSDKDIFIAEKEIDVNYFTRNPLNPIARVLKKHLVR